MSKDYFISFEGIDGSGKSTQYDLTSNYLNKAFKNQVVSIREPGGTDFAETLRTTIKSKDIPRSPRANLLAFQSARADLVERVILPALRDEKIVLADRFADSTRAYQGYGEGLGLQEVENAIRIATQGLEPSLTLFYDIELSQQRTTEQAYFETLGDKFQQRVLEGYKMLAKKFPERIKVINRVPAKTSEESIERTFKEKTLPLILEFIS